MRTTHRSFEDDAGDFGLICRFILENNAQIRTRSTWCIGRFVDWRYALWGEKMTTPGFWTKNAHLWFDGFGQLTGFAVSEEGDRDIAIITGAGWRFLFEEMLLWCMENWGHRAPGLSVEITSRQRLEEKYLEQNCFRRRASFYRSSFELQSNPIIARPLREGYKIVSMASQSDYRRQVCLRLNAFQGKSAMSDDEIESRLPIVNHAITNPIYHANTDLCVVAPDGTFVSGCEALIDTRNLEADIERVCTHADYRRSGFAKAVICECLGRLKEMGLHKAYITGYSDEAIGLYSSLGGCGRSEFYQYSQDK